MTCGATLTITSETFEWHIRQRSHARPAVQREQAEAFQGKTALLPECRYARVEQEAGRKWRRTALFIY